MLKNLRKLDSAILVFQPCVQANLSNLLYKLFRLKQRILVYIGSHKLYTAETITAGLQNPLTSNDWRTDEVFVLVETKCRGILQGVFFLKKQLLCFEPTFCILSKYYNQ